MSTKDTNTQFDALLREQLSQLNPEVPEGVWESMEADLDQLNESLQFDSSIRESMNQLNVPAPQGVFEAIQSQLSAGIGSGFSLASKWIIGSLITCAAVVSTLVLMPSDKKKESAQNPVTPSSITETSPTTNNDASNPEVVADIPAIVAEDDHLQTPLNAASLGGENPSQVEIIAPATSNNDDVTGTNPGPRTLVTKNKTSQTQSGNELPSPIESKKLPIFAFAQKDTLICWGLPYKTYLKHGDNCFYDVYVNGTQIGKSVPGNQGFQYIASSAGVYQVDWVVRMDDQVWKKSQLVYVQSLPELRLQVNDLGNGRYAFINEGKDKTNWFLDGQPSSLAEVQLYDEQPTDHKLHAVAVNAAGCKDSANLSFRNNVIFEVKPIKIPNTFTPNGDGKNDYFEVEVEGATSFHIYIFNSESQVVFESTDPKAKWDGSNKFKGNHVLQGTYTCIVKYALAGGEIMQEMKVIHLLKD